MPPFELTKFLYIILFWYNLSMRRLFHNEKFTRLITMNVDGSDMYNLSDDNFVSHCCWKNDKEILSFLRKKLYQITTKTLYLLHKITSNILNKNISDYERT